MSLNEVKISLPTDQTTEGPRIISDRTRLEIEYDHMGGGNVTRWAKIIFTETLFYRFCDISCCEENDILSATIIRKRNTSQLLQRVLARWDESVGWQEWQQQQGGSSRFWHFTVFFDDVGAIDVVSSNLSVSEDKKVT